MERADRDGIATATGWRRWEPLTGIAFIALFVAGFLIENVPDESASNAVWRTYFADRGHQVVNTVSGFVFVAAGLCLLAFLTTVWQRVVAAGRTPGPSPLPIVAAGVAAACIAIGGVAQAVVTGSMLFGSMPEPGADAVRLSFTMGFPLIAVAGMFAASLSVAGLSIQAHHAGLLGRRLLTLGLVIAAGLLASVLFLPMVLLPVWIAVMTAILMRRRSDVSASVGQAPSAQLSGAATRAPNGAATPAAR